MSLENLPLLDADYPLFDWADWPDAKAALVQGGLVSAFSRHAWNALVDKLYNVLTDAGLTWSNTHGTYEETRMSETSNKLMAEMFNALIWNIDTYFKLSWPWAVDPTFRGYIGRKAFIGYSTASTAADVVYPEYIEEYARELNTFIELLRGTFNTLYTTVQHNARTTVSTTVRSSEPVSIESGATSVSTTQAELSKRPSRAIEGADVVISTEVKADVQRRTSRPAETAVLIPLRINHEVESLKAAVVRPPSLLLPVVVQVAAEALRILATSTEIQSRTNVQATVDAFKIVATTISMRLETLASASLARAVAKACACGTLSQSIVTSTLNTAETKNVSTAIETTATATASMQKARPFAITSSTKAASLVLCSVDVGWLPPIWVNGGLWIRQVHNEPVQRDDGSLEVS